MSRVAEKHKAEAPRILGAYIVTCSTSKYAEARAGKIPKDESGDLIQTLIEKAGHRVVGRKLISDARMMIRKALKEALRSRQVNAILVTGGTGLSPRDVTVETVENLIEKRIPGFGELFRKISYDKIGSPAMMSRAIGGVVNGKAIFCLPGSPDGVETALTALILPELPHIIGIANQN